MSAARTSRGTTAVALFVAWAASSCALMPQKPPAPLAEARSAGDFDSYEMRRVGLMPFTGDALDPTRSAELQQAFLFELSRRAPYEIVLLDDQDLAEVDAQFPHQRGTYTARAVIETARRFHLDGMLVGTVTHMESYAPQALGLELELVASETGLVIWSSTLEVDTADAVVRRSLESYSAGQRDENDRPVDVQITLISPSRLMRFAASEVARTL